MTLQPLQGKAREAVQQATARFNIWEGAVRSSKTVSSLLAWSLFVRQAPPGNLLMVGRTERTLKRNVIDVLVEWYGPKRAKYIAGAGEFWLFGRRIYVAGADNEASVAKIQGLTLLGAYVDEASTIPESFWSMLGTRLSERGAKCFATSNPDNPSHWLKKGYLDKARLHITGDGRTLHAGGAIDLHRFSFRLADNPNLDAEYVAALEAEYVGLWRKRFILGEWVVAEGAIYDAWDPDRHVVDTLPDIYRWLALGVDYGTRNPFAALLIGVGDDPATRRPTLYVAGEWRYDSREARRSLSDAEYSDQVRAWLQMFEHSDGLVGVRPEWVVVDPSAASFVTQLHRDKLSPTLADNAVLDGIRTVSSLLARDRLKVHASCTGLINEIPGYAWDDKAAEKGEDKPIKVDDHSCDGLRYGIHTTQAAWRGLLAA